MKFAVYGAGYRGKKLTNFLGEDNVVAFIDQDEKKIGSVYLGKPVIDVEEYKAKFESFMVLISPIYTNEIEAFLEENDIYQYSNLLRLPSEFSGYGNCNFKDIISGMIKKIRGVVFLYGINAYSLMLYEGLKNLVSIKLIQDGKGEERLVEWIKKTYSDIDIESIFSIPDKAQVLLAVRMSEQEIIEKFPNNLVLDAFYFSSNMSCYYNSDIEKFKHKFECRKRCFIVANGPSLKIDDLESLKGEFCIGMNKIYMVDTLWKPDVYVCLDSFLINKETENIASYKCSYKFIGDSGEKYWEIPRKNSYKIHAVSGDSYNVLPPFSEDISQKVYSYHTVTHSCIQIACFMGFSEIYLIGVDCNYIKGSNQNYFYKSNEADNLDHNENGMILAYKSAKKYADEHGIKIYNATRGGMLEVFERVDFDSIFA